VSEVSNDVAKVVEINLNKLGDEDFAKSIAGDNLAPYFQSVVLALAFYWFAMWMLWASLSGCSNVLLKC
jgi:hypothetical protein